MFEHSVNKFGRAVDCDSGANTDIWDRANGTDLQKIWTAPTQARVHDIASASANDAAAGTGCRKIGVYGLTSWLLPEVYEEITLNGTSNVETVNSYVIVHRMRCLDWGSAGPNAGKITATAKTDGTVTAQITAGAGQTQMAVYGIPEKNTFQIHRYYASAIKASASLSAAISLLVNPIPQSQLAGFLTKHTNGVATEGTNYLPHQFEPPFHVSGPAIVKLQANSSSNNTDVSGGFDGELVMPRS